MNDKQAMQQQITAMQDTLIELRQNYSAAIREAWIDGFEHGCGKPDEAFAYSGKHYGNSDFRKRLKQ